MALKAVSLFSNCGAGDVGYRAAGFNFEVMAELDPRRLKVCKLNHPGASGVAGDLRKTWKRVVSRYKSRNGRRRPALLAACPPCQGMSSARHDRGLSTDADAGSKDPRNLLVSVIANVADALEPKLVVVENVPEFLSRKIRHPETGDPVSASVYLIDRLASRYHAFAILTDLSDYGVPQTRKRAFLTFVRRDVPGLQRLLVEGRAPFPMPRSVSDPPNGGRITLRQALASFGLPSLDAGSKDQAACPIIGPFHSVPVWNSERYAMVAAIPSGSGASAWQNNSCRRCGPVEVEESGAVCPKCEGPLLRPVIKKEDGTYRLITGFRSSSYRRMSPDKPAPTVTTASGHVGSNLTIHPFENRLLSPLECARLQTFPETFKWGAALKRWGSTNVREMIGEAVPPLFTELHGDVLRELITGKWAKSASISSDDTRCSKARLKLGQPAVQAEISLNVS